MIEGVLFKELVTHTDERGFFREIIRCNRRFFCRRIWSMEPFTDVYRRRESLAYS